MPETVPHADASHARAGGPSPEETLRECCRRTAPGSIVTTDFSLVVPGMFAEVTEETVTLAVLQIEQPLHNLRRSMCLVSFTSSEGSCAFFSYVLDVRPGDLHTQLVVEMPEQILHTETCSYFRVPVFKDHPIEVDVFDKRGQWSAVAEDISFTGIRIRFEGDADPAFEKDDTVEIKLCLGKQIAAVTGIVRYRAEPAYGIFFPEVMTGNEARPTVELRELVVAARNCWLRNRIA